MPHALRLALLFTLLAAALLLAAPAAQGQSLVINEFLADPDGYSGGEFVEIYNRGNDSVDLNGYTISDGNGMKYTFGNVTLASDEYATILDGSDDEVPGFTDVISEWDLNDTGDTITLLAANGDTVDTYTYEGSEVDEDGVSQALDPNGNANSNFALSNTFNENDARFTPGENNEAGDNPLVAGPGDLIVSEFMADPDDVPASDGEYIEIYNDAATQTRLEGYTVRDEGSNSFIIDNPQGDPVIVPAGGFVVLCENPDPTANGGVACDYDYPNDFSLSNDDEIIVEDAEGIEITRVTFADEDARGNGVAFELAAFADGRSDDNQTVQADYQGATLRLNDVDEDTNDRFDRGSPGGLGAAVYASGNPGYRLLSVPVAGMTVQDLAVQNLIQGVPGSNYPNAAQNFYVGYDGSNYGTPEGFSDVLAPEVGIYWQFYGTARVPETDPLPDSLTSTIGAGPTEDVTADVSNAGQTFFLLGNPYDSNYDLEGLDLAAQDFSTTVQVWDPNAAGVQNGNDGSYKMVTQGSSGDTLSVWQGFFAERSSGSATQLTFSEGGQVAGPADFYGGNSATEPQRRVLPLRLTGRDASGDVTSFDRAARLYFHPDALLPEAGPDGWDATKLTPFTAGAFATLALAPPGALKAQEGLPFVLSEEIAVPVAFHRSGAGAGTAFTIAWPQEAWENIPEGWALTLEDTQAGQTVDLRAEASYAFTLPPGAESNAAARAATPASGLPLPLAEALRGGNASAGVTEAEGPRFLLRIDPNAGLPVEAGGFTAEADGRDALLVWRTRSETGNAHFVVERQAERSGAWKEAKTVVTKAQGGTSSEPIRYRARVEDLAYGTHVFRLRQVDGDGTSTVLTGAPQRVEIVPDGAYALSAPYPNPTSGRATVEVAAREAGPVTVMLFDTRGRKVRTLFDGALPGSETKRLTLDARSLASGVYIVRLRGERGTRTQTVTLVR